MFMRYVMARFEVEQREQAYRIYVTDALRAISESAAKLGGGSYIQVRYADMFDRKPRDERTHDEIVEHIRGCLRGLE